MKKRLYRSRSNKKIFGVCGGIAEYTGIDVTFIRLAVALTTIFTTQFVLAPLIYLLCAFILPKGSNEYN